MREMIVLVKRGAASKFDDMKSWIFKWVSMRIFLGKYKVLYLIKRMIDKLGQVMS